MRTIELTQGQVTIVDDCDADLDGVNWHAQEQRNEKTYYAVRHMQSGSLSRRKAELLHRVILGRVLGRPLLAEELCDHINQNTLDNRRDNLRLASNKENARNRGKRIDNSSGFKGVRKRKTNFAATIRVDGRNIHLGTFNTPEEAHKVYCEAAQHYFGEFANNGE